jgi:hypothetical protein
MAYKDLYSEGSTDDVGQLQLLTSPLASTEEVLALFAGGLAPVEIALPAVLHSIGTNKDQIDAAVEEAKKTRDLKRECERCEAAQSNADHSMAMKEREAGVEKTRKETALMQAKPAPAASH